MADIIGRLGIENQFAGGADTLTIKLSNRLSHGIQIAVNGFDLNAIKVEVRVEGTTRFEEVEIDPSATASTVIGRDFFLEEIRFSEVPAGENTIYVKHLSN